MLKHAKSMYEGKNPQSVVGSRLKLEEMPSKQFVGCNSEEDDLVMSDREDSPRPTHLESTTSYGKLGSGGSRVKGRKSKGGRSSKRRHQRLSRVDDSDDRISSHEESQKDDLMPPNRESMHASKLH